MYLPVFLRSFAQRCFRIINPFSAVQFCSAVFDQTCAVPESVCNTGELSTLFNTKFELWLNDMTHVVRRDWWDVSWVQGQTVGVCLGVWCRYQTTVRDAKRNHLSDIITTNCHWLRLLILFLITTKYLYFLYLLLTNSTLSPWISLHMTLQSSIFIKNLLAIDSGDCVILVLLDLTAGFDTVNHTVLLCHLEQWVGIRGTALECFSEIDRSTPSVSALANMYSPLLLLNVVSLRVQFLALSFLPVFAPSWIHTRIHTRSLSFFHLLLLLCRWHIDLCIAYKEWYYINTLLKCLEDIKPGWLLTKKQKWWFLVAKLGLPL